MTERHKLSMRCYVEHPEVTEGTSMTDTETARLRDCNHLRVVTASGPNYGVEPNVYLWFCGDCRVRFYPACNNASRDAGSQGGLENDDA